MFIFDSALAEKDAVYIYVNAQAHSSNTYSWPESQELIYRLRRLSTADGSLCSLCSEYTAQSTAPYVPTSHLYVELWIDEGVYSETGDGNYEKALYIYSEQGNDPYVSEA